MQQVWPVITTLLTVLALLAVFSTKAIGFYSHQLLGIVLLLGLLWGLVSRLWWWKKDRLHGQIERNHKNQLFQAFGRGFFFLMVGLTTLAVFPRTWDMLSLLAVVAVATLATVGLQRLQPKQTNKGPTVAMVLAGLVIAFDLVQAFRPTVEPVLVLQAPFEGEWLVLQGGRSPLQSHHLTAYNQTYALDLVHIKDGKIFRSGEGNENNHSWEAPLYAPIDGQVVEVRNNMEDNEGLNLVSDTANATGNHVIIQTDDGHYVVLAHLRQNTIAVTEGQRINRGDLLGKTGNSGNTTMPHLHFQVQTHRDLWDPDNRSVPFTFSGGITHRRNDRVQGRT